MKTLVDKVFILLFFVILLLPLLFLDFKNNNVSESENRILSNFPEFNSDINNFMKDYNIWFNEHIGFRSKIITVKSLLDYKLFNKITNDDIYIGKTNTLIYATDKIIESYHNRNLPSQEELNDLSISLETLQNYINSFGIQFYYVPCYDKQVIYPEKFMKYINQYGDKSRTEIIVEKLVSDENLNVIDFKQDLIDGKDKYLIYGDWSDPTHWTRRGAYIGYLKIMNKMKENNKNLYILQEEDYNLYFSKIGYNLTNNYYNYDNVEFFDIKSMNAKIVSNDILGELKKDERHVVYENSEVNNNLKLLIIGDSYIKSFLVDDFAESFFSVAMVWHNYLTYDNLNKLIDSYEPNIIILENAERVNIEHLILAISKDINKTK